MVTRFLPSLVSAALVFASAGCTAAPTPQQATTAESTAAKPAPPAKPVAPDQVLLVLDWVAHGSHGPFHLAVEKGYYKEANLDVSIQDGSGSLKTVQAIGGGQGTIGFASLASMAQGRGQGMPLKSVAGLMPRNVFGVFVPKDSGIMQPKDLEGKQVLVTPGSFETLLLTPFFARNGVDATKVRIVGVDAAAKVADYVAGKADAVITDVPYASPTIQPLRPSDTLLWADYGLVLPAYGLFTREDVIDKNPDMVRRFARATLKGWEYSLRNMDEAVEALMKHRAGKVKAEAAKQELVLYADFMVTERTRGKPLGWQSDEDWREALLLLKEYADLKGSDGPTAFFTNEFIGQ